MPVPLVRSPRRPTQLSSGARRLLRRPPRAPALPGGDRRVTSRWESPRSSSRPPRHALLPLRAPRSRRPLRRGSRVGPRACRAPSRPETGELVFDFTNWDARAFYFHDPAGSIVELIAHRGIGEGAQRAPSQRRSCSGSPRSASSAIRPRRRRRSRASSASRCGTARSKVRRASPSSARRRER